MILPPKNTAKIWISLLRAWTKRTQHDPEPDGEGQQQLVVAFSEEGSGGQPFGGSDQQELWRDQMHQPLEALGLLQADDPPSTTTIRSRLSDNLRR